MIRVLALAAVVAAGACHGHHRPAHRYHAVRTPKTLFPSLHVTVPPASGGGSAPPSTTPAPPPTGTTSTPAPPPAAYPSRTGVDEGEYYVRPAHRTLAAGAVELNTTNYGMDDHDITVDDPSGHQIAQAYLVPGATAQLELTLPAGTYRLFCSLYNGAHDQAGMHANLVVSG
jgi:plastocyanin